MGKLFGARCSDLQRPQTAVLVVCKVFQRCKFGLLAIAEPPQSKNFVAFEEQQAFAPAPLLTSTLLRQ